jgi:hypothetical protein
LFLVGQNDMVTKLWKKKCVPSFMFDAKILILMCWKKKEQQIGFRGKKVKT